ncbi:Flp family type IVb pilin [Mixta intestinalis]|jgi:pilus assembly protein Flp/PilA|uniref:Flp/Fap pilin component n=1 Tax=Mixta intestinalis TaxID=1615494 RepID=A0A6P1Q676_9GAMM|nr:Flp family type IVb pilin [Mixta intestinalis]QHM73458.1 hypothetical protein C7M51_03805 [Mixta intestinalis]
MNSLTKLYVAAQVRLAQFGKNEKGVTAIEYALIGVAMATLLAFVLGDQDSGYLGALKDTFTKITDAITSVTIDK